jgi:hypothetical protein
MSSSHSCFDECFPPAFLPSMLHKVYPSQNRHRLVLTHVLPLEVYEGSSFQHVLDGGARCDGTSQVIRPTYSCPCPTDLGQPCRCT